MPTKPAAKKCPRGHKAIMVSAKSGKCDACEREDAIAHAPRVAKQPTPLRPARKAAAGRRSA